MSQAQQAGGVEELHAESPEAPPADLHWATGFVTGSAASRAFHWAFATLGGLLTAVAVAVYAPSSWFTPVWVVVAAVLPALAVVDARTKKLPNIIVKPLGALAVAVAALLCATGSGQWADLGVALALGAAASAFYFVVWFAAPAGGFGFGDVRLAAVTGFALGLSGPYAVFLGVLLVPLLIGVPVGLLAEHVKRSRGTELSTPFGPAMAAGALAAMFHPTLFALAILGPFAGPAT